MSNYVKNHMGLTLSDDDMKDIPYPTTELTMHVTQKTLQLSTLVSALIYHPVRQIIKKDFCPINFFRKGAQSGKRAGIFGLLAGPILTYFVVSKRSINEEGMYDRSYRLRHNQNQVRVDRFAIIGGSAGLATLAIGKGFSIGGVWGYVGGIVTSAVYNKFINDK